MKKVIVLIGTLLACFAAEAKTLVISDIDDTLKQAHILNRREMVEKALQTNNVFLGMNGVFVALKYDQPDLRFIYLTNALDSLMHGLHTRFLAGNQFPEGPVLLRKSIFDGDFKLTQLRAILSSEKPDRVLFLGDNGEKDILIYAQIQKEFPQVQIQTFIHLIYSAKNRNETGAVPLPGQIGFATSFDLLLQLTAASWVRPETLTAFYAAYANSFLVENGLRSDAAIAIPAWMDCRDFQWTLPDVPNAAPVFATVKEKIVGRCAQPQPQALQPLQKSVK